jgi:hypothetical protein
MAGTFVDGATVEFRCVGLEQELTKSSATAISHTGRVRRKCLNVLSRNILETLVRR